MSQYTTGTVAVTNGSTAVVGTLTSWVGNIAVGQVFLVNGVNVTYTVAAVTDNTHLTLNAAYAGPTNATATYAVVRDYTPNYSLPLIQPGDLMTGMLVNRACTSIDTLLSTFLIPSLPISVAIGGTGATTLAANGLLLGNGAAAISAITTGANGLVLTSNGTAPVWSTVPAAGTTGQIQFNNSGSLGAFTLGGDATVNTSTGSLTVAKIGGQSFALAGGSALTLTTAGATNVTLPVSGTLVNSAVTTLSSLASVGTLTTGTWNATIISGQYGGTGVNNSGKTITLAANLSTSGAYNVTLTSTATTNVTLPPSGTLLANSNNLSDVSSATTARTNLGLGTMATQGAGAVAITGGSITGMPTAVNPSDVVTYSQVQSLIATGPHDYREANAYFATNVTISGPGALTDGSYTVVSGNVILLVGQSTGSQNGPWTYNGSGSALTRPVDYASGTTVTDKLVYSISGTGSSKQYWMYVCNTAPDTVDTTSTSWGIFLPQLSASAPIYLSGGNAYLGTNGVTNSYLAQMAANTIKGNNTASLANAADLTVSQVSSMLGLVASATTDTTNASNISSGTLAAARGGAGSIAGLLYGNGAGVVSAASSANLITALGYTPLNPANNLSDLSNLLTARTNIGVTEFWGGTTGNTGNAYTATCTVAPTAYTNGMTVRCVINAANSGAATINVNGLGAVAITKNGTNALSTGDLTAGGLVQLTYDGTEFQLVSGAGASGGGNSMYSMDWVAGTGFTAGATTSLTLSSTPLNAASVMITFDGIVQQRDMWSLSGKAVTFTSAIPVGVTEVEATWGVPIAVGNGTSLNYQDFAAGVGFTAGTTTTLTLSGAPFNNASCWVDFDGVSQHRSTWSVSGTTLTFTSAIPVWVSEVEVSWGTAVIIGTPALGTVGTAQMASGNLTLSNSLGVGGTAPTTGSNGWTSVEAGYAGNGLAGFAGNNLWLVNNCYYNSGWKFAGATSWYATGMQMSAGAFTFYASSAAGTSGGAATMNTTATLSATGLLAASGGYTLADGGSLTASQNSLKAVTYIGPQQTQYRAGENLISGTHTLGLNLAVQSSTTVQGTGTEWSSDSTGSGGGQTTRGTIGNGIALYNNGDATGFGINSAAALTFGAGNAKVATLSTAGNFGLSVTPSTWSSSWSAFQLGTNGPGFLATYNGAVGDVILGSNFYQNGSSQNTYVANGYASSFTQYQGAFTWQTAASGTAGNAVTFSTPMTLDASGNLTITGSATKPGGGSWTATSDGRTKQNVSQYTDGLAAVLQLVPQVYEYNGLGGTVADGKQYVGFIAQDVQLVLPRLVGSTQCLLNPTDTEQTDILNVDDSSLVYVLVNAVKELSSQLAAQAAQVAALTATKTGA